jgi:hypothetical protein
MPEYRCYSGGGRRRKAEEGWEERTAKLPHLFWLGWGIEDADFAVNECKSDTEPPSDVMP